VESVAPSENGRGLPVREVGILKVDTKSQGTEQVESKLAGLFLGAKKRNKDDDIQGGESLLNLTLKNPEGTGSQRDPWASAHGN